MNQTLQKNKALADKIRADRRLDRPITRWAIDIVRSYRIGQDRISEDSMVMLGQILREFYNETARDVLSFDVREYKQFEDETIKDITFKQIAGTLSNIFFIRVPNSVRSISNTTNKALNRTNELAISENMTQIEADRTLANYMKNHKSTIVMTESQWTVETTRAVTVKSINQPLKNLAEEIADQLNANRLDDAVTLSKHVKGLLKLPASEKQGKLMNVLLDNTKKVVDPIEDKEIIMDIKKKADALGLKKKKWATIGDSKVRASHGSANGQIKDVDEPFELAGGNVRYPGDGSLGASLGELVNCRCASIYL